MELSRGERQRALLSVEMFNHEKEGIAAARRRLERLVRWLHRLDSKLLLWFLENPPETINAECEEHSEENESLPRFDDVAKKTVARLVPGEVDTGRPQSQHAQENEPDRNDCEAT